MTDDPDEGRRLLERALYLGSSAPPRPPTDEGFAAVMRHLAEQLAEEAKPPNSRRDFRQVISRWAYDDLDLMKTTDFGAAVSDVLTFLERRQSRDIH